MNAPESFVPNHPCPNDVCPVPPLDTARVPEIFARVVVACQVGIPFTRASTCPSVPAVVVDSAPDPLPRRSVFVLIVDHPVPPYTAARVELADTTPEIACSGPVREPTVNPPLNVFRAVKVFAVYVFGIVVEALM